MAFIANLMESGVQFVAVDMPFANELTVHVMAAMAQYEGKAISERTKAALAAAKDRGVKLGNPKNMNEEAAARGRVLAVEKRKANADRRAENLSPDVEWHLKEGLFLNAIARKLTEDKILTPRGKDRWTPMTVKNVIRRAEKRKEHRPGQQQR